MSSAALDRLLAALIVGLAATGAVSLVSGAPRDAWLFLVHDLLAGALAAAVVVKLARSLPQAVRARRWSRVAVGSVVWVDLGFIRWTLLTLHVVAGIALVPFVLLHLAPRRWRVLRPRTAARRSGATLRHAVGSTPFLTRRAVL